MSVLPQVILDKLDACGVPPESKSCTSMWKFEREAMLLILVETLHAHKNILDRITVERVASLLAPPLEHAVAAAHGTYLIAMAEPTARTLSEVLIIVSPLTPIGHIGWCYG